MEKKGKGKKSKKKREEAKLQAEIQQEPQLTVPDVLSAGDQVPSSSRDTDTHKKCQEQQSSPVVRKEPVQLREIPEQTQTTAEQVQQPTLADIIKFGGKKKKEKPAETSMTKLEPVKKEGLEDLVSTLSVSDKPLPWRQREGDQQGTGDTLHQQKSSPVASVSLRDEFKTELPSQKTSQQVQELQMSRKQQKMARRLQQQQQNEPQNEQQKASQEQIQKNDEQEKRISLEDLSLKGPLRAERCGSGGRSILIETNHLALRVRPKYDSAIHYDVTIIPDRPKKLFRRIWEAFRQKYFPKK